MEERPSPLRRLGRALKRGFRRVTGPSNRKVRRLYAEEEYLDAYSAHTDIRVHRDPHAAVGGHWFTHGKLQLDFLVGQGLRPGHRLLEIGGGTLRAGRHFASYLEPGGYTGVDISPAALQYAHALVEREGLADRKPRLLLNETKRLTFDFVRGERFDFLIAYSVFTHLKPAHVEECFRHVGSVLAPGAAFFFTYNESPTYVEDSVKDFRFPRSFFEKAAAKHDLSVEPRPFEDPTGQRMLRLARA